MNKINIYLEMKIDRIGFIKKVLCQGKTSVWNAENMWLDKRRAGHANIGMLTSRGILTKTHERYNRMFQEDRPFDEAQLSE